MCCWLYPRAKEGQLGCEVFGREVVVFEGEVVVFGGELVVFEGVVNVFVGDWGICGEMGC